MINKDNVYSIIKTSGALPTLPAILLKLLEACDNNDTPLSEISALINKDPVLSCKVLQLVNSAYYGFRYSFKGIEQAVVYLGANAIKNIAVTMSVYQVFDRKHFKRFCFYDFNAFWYHSLMCATLAKRIAQNTGYSNIDEAYLSGLLHDIGKLILVSTFPKEYKTILEEANNREDILRSETQLLGVNHYETGSWLMQTWQLSSMMIDAIRYHHEPQEKIREAFPLVRIVYAANLLHDINADSDRVHKVDGLLIGLNDTDVQKIVEGAAEEVEQIATNLEIRIRKPSGSTQPKKTQNAANQETIVLKSENQSLIGDAPDNQEIALQDALKTRIKSVSLLSSFLEGLVQAEDVEAIIAACEQTVNILFNIEKVLFFLPDKNNVLLRGYTSPTNSLHQTSQGLTLTLPRSSSLIVKTYHDMSMASLTDDTSAENLADRQILSVLNCSTVLMVPLVADHKPAGIILLGFPPAVKSLSISDCKLVQVVAQQVGLCLQLERMKEQKQADLESERRAAVSMTARKVAHEINNPLGIISNYIASIKLRLSDDEQINSELTIIDEEIHRISSMIGQLDMFSQDRTYSFELTDINTIIADIVHLIKAAHFIRSGISVSFVPDSIIPHIITSRDAIRQVLINLLKNAAEAMNNGGTVTVTTRQATKEISENRDGIEIVVADTGPGLPDSIKASLYTPFVTTKQNGHSGLGLSIVHKTVKDLGGRLSCSSSPRDGTSFSIFLPNSSPDELRQTRML